MLGGIGGKRRRGQQRLRWLDGITDLMDTQVLLLGRGAVLPLQLRPAGLGTQPLSSQGIQSKAGDPKTQA